MTKKSETGHTLNCANFQKLIDLCRGFGGTYNPVQSHLPLAALQTLQQNVQDKLTEIANKQPVYNQAISEREALFAEISPLATLILNAMVASGVPKSSIDNAKTVIRKLKGQRATPTSSTVPTDPNSTVPTPRTISTSQLSFDSRIGNFERLVEILAAEPNYRPNEVPLQVDTLQAFLVDLRAKNAAAINADIMLSGLRNTRNKLMYQDEHCLYNTVTDIKAYIKSLFGPKSAEFHQATKLKFTRIRM